MSAKPETTFVQGVNKKVPKSIYRMKNNNQYTGGIPDVWYSGPEDDMWVEYKFIPRQPTRAPVIPKKLLSALQLQWLTGRYEEGRQCVVIIGCPGGGVILDTPEQWNAEIPAKDFVALIRSQTDLAKWIETQVS